MLLFTLYPLTLIFLVVFSYGFVDANLPFKTSQFLYDLVHFHRGVATLLYSIIVIFLFGFYGWVLWLVKRKRLSSKQIWRPIGVTVVILFFSFPAFSYDIFNYLATAKVTFSYRENPYIVMPIEIPNEPMLKFMHAANKTALYGPVWILLTAIPHFIGFNNLFLTIFTFKAFILLFYLGVLWLIWSLSNKNTWALSFFALNPLVVVETLISAHNDVVMIFFALLSFYLLKKKNFLPRGAGSRFAGLSVICFLLSVLIKFATLFLLPVYGYLLYLNLGKQKVDWEKVWQWSAILMFIIFLLSPIREELYPWYLIWPLTFVAFMTRGSFLSIISLAFSFSLLFRVTPFLYTRHWGGQTPFIKKIVTLVPVLFSLIFLFLKKVKTYGVEK